jgi:hypothetical protein
MKGLTTRRTFPLILIVILMNVPSSAFAQDEEEQVEKGLRGTLIFEDIPVDLTQLMDKDFNWRFQALQDERRSKVPLEEMKVVVIHSESQQNPRAASLKISGYQIHPRSMVLPPGSTVSFKNEGVDLIVKVEGRSGVEPMVFDGEKSSAKQTLDKPGRYIFRATNYTSVVSYVNVLTSFADSNLTSSGPEKAEFNLGDVPKGSYELRVYFRGTMVLTEKIIVNSKGKSNESRFLITRSDFINAMP